MQNNKISNSFQQYEGSISGVIEQNSSNQKIFNEVEELPKKKLNCFVYLLNILWMLMCCHAAMYYIFAPMSQGTTKGKLAAAILGLTVLVGFPTFWYLISLSRLAKLAFMLDTIQVATIIAGLSFVGMILLFDKTGGVWYYKVIQIGFVIEAFCYSTMLRVMLVTLQWSKWQVIVFKFHAMMNCLMLFVGGVYFIWIDFSYTNHLLKSFDKKVHDFMVLFIFTMFGSIYEFYKKITDLDYTGELKYTYQIKNVDQNRHKKTKNISKKRLESIKSIQLLERSQKLLEPSENKNQCDQKFIEVQVMN